MNATKSLETRLTELESKYCDLVWFARSDPDTENVNVRKKQDEVKAVYSEECDALQIQETSDWQHGFNSGMLAATRLIRSYVTKEICPLIRKERIAYAEEEFPVLDT